jgi:hypothetical protein
LNQFNIPPSQFQVLYGVPALATVYEFERH